MDSRLLARIAAAVFIAIALTLSVLALREEPEAPPAESGTVWQPDGDPLPATLHACSAMGEQALSSPDCRAAWAEKRRRFLGVEGDAAPAGDLSAARGE